MPLEAALNGAAKLVRADRRHDRHPCDGLPPDRVAGGATGSLFASSPSPSAGTVAISGVVALTLSPVMSAGLLKPGWRNAACRPHLPRYRSG